MITNLYRSSVDLSKKPVRDRRFITALMAMMAGLCALLTGCTTVHLAGLQPGEPMPSGHGLLAVQVVSNSYSLSSNLRNWSDIVLVDREREDSEGRSLVVTIPAVINGLSSTRVFVGALPPGNYRFAGLRAYRASSGMGAYSAFAPVGTALGSFAVESDRLTSLGTVYFQPLYADPMSNKIIGSGESMRFVASRIDDDDALDEFVASHHPELARALGAQPSLGWEPDQLQEQRERLRRAIRDFALLGRPQSGTANGALTFGGRLGTLHRRDQNGQWAQVHVNGNRELLAFREVDGEFIAGGERGLICRSPAFLGPWSCGNLADRNQSIVWIGPSYSGNLFLVARERDRVRLYRSQLAGEFDWQLMREFGELQATTRDESTHASARPVSAFLHEDRLNLADINWTFSLDLTSNAVVSSPWPRLFALVEQPNGILLASPHSAWTGTKPPILSKDSGKTWQTLQRLGEFHTLPYMLEAGDLLAIDSDSTYVFIGWRKKERVSILRAAANSTESRAVGNLPYGCSEILSEVSRDDHVLVRCFDGTLLASEDEGASWALEYSKTVREEAIPREFLIETRAQPSNGSTE